MLDGVEGIRMRQARLLLSDPGRMTAPLADYFFAGGSLQLSLGIFFLVVKSIDLLLEHNFRSVPEFPG